MQTFRTRKECPPPDDSNLSGRFCVVREIRRGGGREEGIDGSSKDSCITVLAERDSC